MAQPKRTRWHKADGRVGVRLRPPEPPDWPDPPMVPTVALRRCQAAETIEEVRAIAAQFLRPRPQEAHAPRR